MYKSSHVFKFILFTDDTTGFIHDADTAKPLQTTPADFNKVYTCLTAKK